MNHVGFVIPVEQRDEIMKALKAQESKFTYGGTFLSIIAIDIAHAARFTVPKPPASPKADVERKFTSKVERLAALKSRIGTPIAETRRSLGAHSGFLTGVDS